MSDKREQSKIWSIYRKFNNYYNGEVPNNRSTWFISQIEKYEFSSVLEIGSCTGRNLKYIGENFKNVKMSGIDVNKAAINFANLRVPNVDFEVLDIYDLEEDEKWDLVFTMGVLIHIHPDGIKEVIEKCISVANKYILHMERNGDGTVLTGPKDLNPTKGIERVHWEPNIDEIYRDLGFNPVVIDVPEGINHSGTSHLVIVDLSDK